MDYREYRSSYETQEESRTPAREQKSAKPILIAIVLLALILCIVIALLCVNLFVRPNYVARSVTVEAGRKTIEANDFLIDKSHNAIFAEGVEYDLSAVGEYSIRLVVDGKECTTKLVVVDTKPPVGNVRNISVWQGSSLEAINCVSDIKDATAVNVSFKNRPDTSSLGKREVTVILEDGGGNKTEYTFVLDVVSTEGLLYTRYVSELGDPIPEADVFTGKPGVGEYLSDISSISSNTAGIYMLQVSANGNVFDVVLEIADSIAPVATVSPQVCFNRIPEASEFVTGIVDMSRVTVKYETEPDPKVSGKIDVIIILSDEYGNSTSYPTYFTVMNDTTPPEILKAPAELEVDTGATIIWRAGVEASDDSGKFELSLDTAGANLDVPGVYTVEIVAKHRGT